MAKKKAPTKKKKRAGAKKKSKPRNGKRRHKPKEIKELEALLTRGDLRLKQKVVAIVRAFDTCGSDKKHLLAQIVDKYYTAGLLKQLKSRDPATRSQGLRSYNTMFATQVRQEGQRLELGGLVTEAHVIEQLDAEEQAAKQSGSVVDFEE